MMLRLGGEKKKRIWFQCVIIAWKTAWNYKFVSWLLHRHGRDETQIPFCEYGGNLVREFKWMLCFFFSFFFPSCLSKMFNFSRRVVTVVHYSWFGNLFVSRLWRTRAICSKLKFLNEPVHCNKRLTKGRAVQWSSGQWWLKVISTF